MEKEYSQKEFNKLPALLTRAQVLEWTGLDPRELAQSVTAKEIEVFSPNGRYKKYRKTSIARICGFSM